MQHLKQLQWLAFLIKSKESIGHASRSVFVMKIEIERAFAFLLYVKFPFSLRAPGLPFDRCTAPYNH